MKKANERSQSHIIIIILLGLNIIIGLTGLLKEDGAIKLEKLRAGGAENFAAIMNFYKSDAYIQQQAESIPMLLEQMGETAPTPSPTPQGEQPNPTPDANASIQEVITQIRAEAPIQGNPNARYTLLEYSDLECPFCKRHFENGTIKALVDQYPDTINYTLRHFPLAMHANAQTAAEALECAAELRGGQTFFDMVAGIFTLPRVSRDGIVAAAGDLGLDTNTFVECLDSGRHTQRVQAQLNEGQSLFGIRGTPGNVIVDSETGRFVAIPGAFPVERFVQELEALIAAE